MAHQKRTEIAQPERRLALVEEQAQALSPELVTGVAILNAELRYVEVSDGLAKLHGLSPEEHWGKTVRDIIPQLAPVVEPLLRKIMDTGEPAFNIELTGNLSGDEDAIHHLVISYIPLYGADNKP
ncbi:MAG: PAS domain-containing protein, partial [Acidobacteria bacterium]|nr:PAS domain-containing protein [Acidobacteriota bacterium]